MTNGSRPSLDSIGVRFGTSKSSLDNDYLAFYETYFERLRTAPLKILEVGVFGGASLRTWHEYFPSARVVGVDISPFVAGLAGDRIAIEIADQSNVQELTDVAIEHGPFDIVLADGSSEPADQLTAFRTLFPFVTSDGLYIAERLSAGSASMEFFENLANVSAGVSDLEYIEEHLLKTFGRAVSSITFLRGVCVVNKAYRAKKYLEKAGLALPLRKPADTYVLLRLSVHVSGVGDVNATDAGIHSGSLERPIEGLTIDTADGSALLEYRVRFGDGSWSDWHAQGRYAGSTGQWSPLTGFSVRPIPNSDGQTEIECVGLFIGESAPIRSSRGADCMSDTDGLLYGMQINVSHKTTGHDRVMVALRAEKMLVDE